MGHPILPTRNNHPQRHRERSPLSTVSGHFLQRATLLLLIAFFAIYTVVEWFSTQHILSQCLELTNNGETKPTTFPTWPSSPVTPAGSEESDEPAAVVNVIDTNVQEAPQPEVASPVVGKVMMMYGPMVERDLNQRLLEGHRKHADLQGHSFHFFNSEVLDGMWSKQAWLLSVMLEQMRKPEHLRTKWLHWADADIVLMNPNIPLDLFLPPPGEAFNHLNLLISNDHNGLNAGTFFIRVNDWGVRFLVDVLAMRTYRPKEKLKYVEQSAMSIILRDEKYSNATMYVPQRWFNAYRGPREGDKLVRGAKVPPNTIKPGDLQLHFSGGKKNKAHIEEWIGYAENVTSGWVVELEQSRLPNEVALFWKLEQERASWDTPVVDAKAKVEEKKSPEENKADGGEKVANVTESVSELKSGLSALGGKSEAGGEISLAEDSSLSEREKGYA